MSTHPVAVYGSLKRGFYNHHLLKGSEYLGRYLTEPRYTLLDLGDYPGAIDRGHTAVAVEVYRVTPRVLARLDWLEGVPHVYERVSIPVPGFGEAFFYVLTGRYLATLGDYGRLQIASGAWK